MPARVPFEPLAALRARWVPVPVPAERHRTVVWKRSRPAGRTVGAHRQHGSHDPHPHPRPRSARRPRVRGGEGSGDEWVAAPADLPVRVLAVVADTLQDYDDIDWAGRPPAVQLAMLRSLERLRSVLDLVQLHVVAGIEKSGAARTDGWATTKDLVTAVTGGPKRRRTPDRGAGPVAHHRPHGDGAKARRGLGLASAGRGGRRGRRAAPRRPGLRDAAEMLLLDEAATRDATELARARAARPGAARSRRHGRA